MFQDTKRLLSYLRYHGRRLFFPQDFFHPGRDRRAALGSTPGVLDQFSIKTGFSINEGSRTAVLPINLVRRNRMRTVQMRATEKILLGVLTAIAVVLPATASAQVIWEADADRGTSVFEGLERSPGEISVVSDPKGMFGSVFRYTIWDNPDGSKDRCESRGHRLTDGTTLRLTRGNTYKSGWRGLGDSNVGTQPGRWVALWQMHAYGGPGMGAPFVLRTLGDGMLHLQNNVEGTNQHIWSTTLQRDVWNTFVIGTHLDPDPEKGWVELWYNGVQQTFINGKTGFFCPTHESEPDTFNKLKWGIYRTGPATGRWNAWMSGARIGMTLADVMDAPPPPPPGALSFEAENLTVTHSGTG